MLLSRVSSLCARSLRPVSGGGSPSRPQAVVYARRERHQASSPGSAAQPAPLHPRLHHHHRLLLPARAAWWWRCGSSSRTEGWRVCGGTTPGAGASPCWITREPGQPRSSWPREQQQPCVSPTSWGRGPEQGPSFYYTFFVLTFNSNFLHFIHFENMMLCCIVDLYLFIFGLQTFLFTVPIFCKMLSVKLPWKRLDDKEIN